MFRDWQAKSYLALDLEEGLDFDKNGLDEALEEWTPPEIIAKMPEGKEKEMAIAINKKSEYMYGGIDTNKGLQAWNMHTHPGQDIPRDKILGQLSVDGIIGEPFAVIYSATKAGIISLTKSFARYFNGNIRVNAVAPGLIDTPLTESLGNDPSWTTDYSIIKRVGRPNEIADAVEFLLSDKSTFITGQILVVDGGFTLK